MAGICGQTRMVDGLQRRQMRRVRVARELTPTWSRRCSETRCAATAVMNPRIHEWLFRIQRAALHVCVRWRTFAFVVVDSGKHEDCRESLATIRLQSRLSHSKARVTQSARELLREDDGRTV